MRRPLDSMLRWWKDGKSPADGPNHANGDGHGIGHGNGNGNGASAAVAPKESPSFVEPPWLAQLDQEGIPRTLRYPTTTLGRIVDQAAQRFADNPAILYNQKIWTYRELLADVNRLAGGLARLGVRPGDRVVLTLPNCPEFVLAFFALQKLGAVVVNAGPLMGVDDLQRVLAMTEPRLLIALDLMAAKIIDACKAHPPKDFVWITLQSYQPLIQRMGYQIKLWQSRDRADEFSPLANHTTLANLLKNAPARPPTVEPSPQALAVLQPTSGTTGAVKLAELTHANLLCNATQVAAWMGSRDGQDSVMAVLPMFHVYGLMTGLINPICYAATIILVTRFDAEVVLDLLVKQRPGIFPLVPAMCDALSNQIERLDPQPVVHGLRLCLSGAAPLPREVAQRFERLTGARVVEGYGLSETSPVTHANLVSRPRYGTIGLPMPDTLCRIVDFDEPAHPVPAGQNGELLVSGPQVMSGYYHDPQATREALWTDAQGRTWLRTGDVARMDADGFFQIMDRKKDVINHCGLKIYPAKVEKVLAEHPRVGDVAVVGQPNPVHNEEVVAVVVAQSSGKEPEDRHGLAEDLLSLCRKHLAKYEVPCRIVFRDQMPRSPLGKISKKVLREELAGAAAQPPQPPEPAKPEAKPAAAPASKEAA